MISNWHSTIGSTLSIGLAKTGIGLIRTHGWWRRRSTVLADLPLEVVAEEEAPHHQQQHQQQPSVPDVPNIHELRDVLTQAQCANLPTTIILADDWVRYFMVTPPKNLMRFADCKAAADMRFQTLYGEMVGDWTLCADWRTRTPFLACAIPRALVASQQQLAQEHKLKLLSIAPYFIAAWNRWQSRLNPAAWLGVVQGDVFTLGVIEQKRLRAVRVTQFAQQLWDDKDALPVHLNREALRLNLPAPSAIQLCGNIPGHWASQSMGTVQCQRLDAAQRPEASNGATSSAEIALAYCGVQ